MSLVLQSISSKADEFCWAHRIQKSLLDLSESVGDKGWFPGATQTRRSTDLRIQIPTDERNCSLLLGLCLGCAAIFYLWWHNFFSLKALNIFTDTQMQGSLSSKLGLFTVCGLFRWFGSTEQRLNPKILLYAPVSSFPISISASDICRELHTDFTELILHRHLGLKRDSF